MNHAYPDRPVVGLFIGVSGAIITGSTMNPPHCHWRHSARASRPGSRDPRSHVARRLQRPLDGSGLRCWRSSQFSSLRDGFGCLPVCSGGHTLCVRTRRGSIVRANRTSRDYQLVRIVLKRRRRVQVGAAVGWAIKRVLRLGRDRGPLSVGQLRANVVTKVPNL